MKVRKGRFNRSQVCLKLQNENTNLIYFSVRQAEVITGVQFVPDLSLSPLLRWSDYIDPETSDLFLRKEKGREYILRAQEVNFKRDFFE